MVTFRNNLRTWQCSECGTQVRFDRVRHFVLGAVLAVPIFLSMLAFGGGRVDEMRTLILVTSFCAFIAVPVLPSLRSATKPPMNGTGQGD